MKNEYRQKTDENRINRIRSITNGLPKACMDFIRSISMSTSTLTRLAYAYDLRVFFNFLIAERILFADMTLTTFTDEKIALISQSDMELYMEYLSVYYSQMTSDENGTITKPLYNHEMGVSRKLSTLRSFFQYLYKSNRIPANITTLIPIPKLHDKPILSMDKNEVFKMLQVTQNGNELTNAQKRYHKFTRTRDYAILCLFLGTGIRISECVGLNISDIDLSNHSFVVTRKGGNQVVLYYPNEVAEALKSYLNDRKKITALPGNGDALFLSLQNKRLSCRAIQNLVKKYAFNAAPLKRKLSPHKLRSTFATQLYHETGDIYLVADALGHANVNTTKKHYASISEKRRREAAKHVHLPPQSEI